MHSNWRKLFVVTGEPSGDQRAAEVVKALRVMAPNLRIAGMGGEALKTAGAEIVVGIEDTAVFGLLEALISLGKFRKIRNKLLDAWLEEPPDATLLVDFGGFNLRFAKSIKRFGAKVAYYISPQVWASRPGRIRWVQKYVDLMMVLFSFEEALYRQHGVRAVHVGHPLVDIVRAEKNRDQICAELYFDTSRKIIGYMSGSRVSEINNLLPNLMKVADDLGRAGYDQQLIIAAPGMSDKLMERTAESTLTVVTEDRYSVMAACDLLIIASGTAALEAALLGRPAVVVYRTSSFTALAAKFLLKLKYVSLPNIIAGFEIYPELLQNDFEPDRVIAEALKILEDKVRCDRIRAQLLRVAESLGSAGADKRAARLLAELMGAKNLV